MTEQRRVTFEASEGHAGERLDAALAAAAGISRSLAANLIARQMVRVNGEPGKASRRLAAGDAVDAELDVPPAMSAAPEDIPLNIVYQDFDLAVIDKPAGMVVHPAAGHTGGTLANALTARFPSVSRTGDRLRPGIVHRLDKDTSGLIVVALTPDALTSLQRQIAERTAGRKYLALVEGGVEPERGIIDAPIGRDPVDRRKQVVYGVAARPARTEYRVIGDLGLYSLVEATLQTGRTHQIRVHFATLGHPIAGDEVYGGRPLGRLRRQFLHAYKLALTSPSTGKRLEFESPLPDDLATALSLVRKEAAANKNTGNSAHPAGGPHDISG